MGQLKVKVLKGGRLPERATDGSAGRDMFARKIEVVEESKYVKVYLGIKTSFPKSNVAEIVPRSGITDTGWVIPNSPGILDSDFRGEAQARFRNIGTKPFPYEVGDRVCQMLYKKLDEEEITVVEGLDTTIRGEGGHGHTGR